MTCYNISSPDAYTSYYQGESYNTLSFRPQQCLHTYHISFKFKTFSPDGFLLQTRGRDQEAGYVRVEIHQGELLVTTYFSNKKEVNMIFIF